MATTLVTVKPGEIQFPIRPSQPVTTILRLDNNNNKKYSVAYKIKTTAPRKYLVRPSSGLLSPGESADIQIILQPQTGDSSIDQHDRFLIQTAVSKSGRPLDREDWSKLSKDDIEEQKIRVTFKASTSGGDTNTTEDSTETKDDLRAKYDELIQYTLSVEKDKKRLEQEIETVKQSSSASANSSGFSTKALLTSITVAIIVARIAPFFGY
ncbi:Vesicle-associated membrane protein-associated protein B/C, putative [Perkinsus marinus ATCC 50983]|uniref:Vesicle-associated membrane protein-associated protein B/C, putative n=1 Tax=Perkinsus marinus (strain ATCC 50983 / TXsc) TaxID=423536 RepID=C5LXQ9_PERM5|nr:Vesicle-associated membrane protein-associated protein B/C, putative [Perkinsus marinus ATCC 50983]EEQ98483.1 Vesicle-associated membrane protein-associated protein B/C, putative [Perkinsus marinus ATCC 50983]|eukprot:XP_002765766.1 Vesicle-associated membrane protein-associated protein B/C, putative [Perkinsus marinus ATCC 50983]